FVFAQDGAYSVAQRCTCRGVRLPAPPVPARFADASFAGFAAKNPVLKRAKAVVQKFAEHYPMVEGGLVLMGPAGSGKTHLVCALLSQIQRKGLPAYYYDFRELLREVRATFDRESGTTQAEVLDPLLHAPLCVIDGVGDEAPRDWVNEQLALIVNRRYNEKLVTIVTSRFFDERTLGELADARLVAGIDPALLPGKDGAIPKGTGLTLEERIGAALLSRFYEMCQFVPMPAEDYRVHIKKEVFPR
ncbi:MAG: ATP-binding protein, partial [Acidobacteriota bacterium]